MQLANRVAVVTGAGRGIGFGIAEIFGREGARVIIGELDEDSGRAAAERLTTKGYQVEAIPLDVTKAGSCAALVERVVARSGGIDILVNNAGVSNLSKAEEMPEGEWRLQVDVMFTGAFFMAQAVARSMIPRRRGVIVNLGSVGGLGAWPLRSAYNAAKAGVIALSDVLATEWAQYGIRVNCVSPGVVRTEMMRAAIEEGVASLEKYTNRTPMGRVAEVDDIARAVLFLASDRASYVTGCNLRVDGGWVAWGNPRGLGFPEEVPHA